MQKRLQPRLAVYSRMILALIPDGATGRRLGLIFTIIGGLAGLPTAYWIWQKWQKTDIDSQVGEVKTDLREVRAILTNQLRTRDATLPGADKPGAEKAKESIEKDIAAAIATLASRRKSEALDALTRNDTRAADAALSAVIKEIDAARSSASREEAELYRQRGALAFLNDPVKALQLYATAAELDASDPKGWNQLGILQARTGNVKAAATSFEKALRLGEQLPDKSILATGYGNLGILSELRGDLSAAKVR